MDRPGRGIQPQICKPTVKSDNFSENSPFVTA